MLNAGDYYEKKTRFTESQIIAVLKEADAGMKVEDVCRQQGIAMRRITNGNPNTAAWRPRTSNV